ncbi:flavin oxidoreductase/NADH oxidase [Calothrix sp. NIES-4101]|nr:flavin oxidoreductase/NADH oxidase [Calothrix sp. NIES-4101]
MNLKTALDAFRAEFINKFPVEKAGIMQRATDTLAKEFIERTTLNVGDIAADFTLTDWVEGGWDIEQSITLSQKLKSLGVDLIDCSSGGLLPGVKIPVGAGYQTPLSDRIRRQADIPTAAVGMITSPEQAEHIIRTEQADMVLLARELLRDPYWSHRAAKALRAQNHVYPNQYLRAW